MPIPLSPRQILETLVPFPTVSRDTNLPLVDWVEDYLSALGISSVRIPNAEGTKAAVYASTGPEVEGGVILSGHTDVVPVDGQDWTSDPWTLTERDGKLFGRGAVDMKGFDALALAAMALAKQRGVKRPLQIALSYDEELGLVGCADMIASMVAGLPKAGAVIVGEPSSMSVVTGHKGGAGFRVHVKGFEVHSSILHRGVNAIMEAARIVDWANAMNAENRVRPPTPLAALFDPPWTSLHVGKIRGGTAHNITAGDCDFLFEFRVVPGEDLESWVRRFEERVAEVEADMKAVRPEAGMTLDRYFTAPPLVPEEGGAAEALARRLTGDTGRHVVSYGTEAGHFQAAGFSTVVCGPGDIAQAHQADEYITVEQFEAGWSFMERLVGDLCA
ncbi:acetylornithine deacetylase [Ostreiculturibacter nitratireducens]|uniref:acetylornithine deacetylase n=1 Tax=Ostreiculturibacter nitratireducens TaxID=3075226 RepID=UPI0031B5FE33